MCGRQRERGLGTARRQCLEVGEHVLRLLRIIRAPLPSASRNGLRVLRHATMVWERVYRCSETLLARADIELIPRYRLSGKSVLTLNGSALDQG
jgi:hypothetical protein